MDASTIDASEHRIHNSTKDQVDQFNQVDQVDPANQVDQVDRVGQNDEALRKMKPPVQPSEEANVDHCEDGATVSTNIEGNHATENAIDGNAPVAVEDVLVKLDKDAKESKTDAKTEVQYNAKENTAKYVETSRTEENEKHVKENAKRDFEKVAEKDFENVNEVAEKDFEKVDEVAEKVADGMVMEVIVDIQLCPETIILVLQEKYFEITLHYSRFFNIFSRFFKANILR